MRSVRVLLPNGQVGVIIDNVPENTTCESLKSRLLGIYDICGKLELHCNGRALRDTEIISCDTVTLVPFDPERVNPYLAVVFLVGHLIPIAYLIQGRRISECLQASVLGFCAFLALKLITKKPYEEWNLERFIPSHNILKDVGSLFARSLIPSFRVEQLLINE